MAPSGVIETVPEAATAAQNASTSPDKPGRQTAGCYAYCKYFSRRAPDWPRPKSDPAHANRIEILGSPNIVQESVFADEFSGDGNAGGCLATGMRAVNAIPAVCFSSIAEI